MRSIYQNITTRLLAQDEVKDLVGQNETYADADDQYAIRPGLLDEDDPYPGIVLALPSNVYDDDLPGVARYSKSTLEVRCLALSLNIAWALRDAVAYDSGAPMDSEGLHGYDTSGILSCQLQSDTEDAYEMSDDSDRLLYVVTSIYQLEIDEGEL